MLKRVSVKCAECSAWSITSCTTVVLCSLNSCSIPAAQQAPPKEPKCHLSVRMRWTSPLLWERNPRRQVLETQWFRCSGKLWSRFRLAQLLKNALTVWLLLQVRLRNTRMLTWPNARRCKAASETHWSRLWVQSFRRRISRATLRKCICSSLSWNQCRFQLRLFVRSVNCASLKISRLSCSQLAKMKRTLKSLRASCCTMQASLLGTLTLRKASRLWFRSSRCLRCVSSWLTLWLLHLVPRSPHWPSWWSTYSCSCAMQAATELESSTLSLIRLSCLVWWRSSPHDSSMQECAPQPQLACGPSYSTIRALRPHLILSKLVQSCNCCRTSTNAQPTSASTRATWPKMQSEASTLVPSMWLTTALKKNSQPYGRWITSSWSRWTEF